MLVLALAAALALAPYIASEPGFDPEKGLLLNSLTTSEGVLLEYERPAVLLPLEMMVGELHRSQRRFVKRVGGVKRDVGSHYFEAELLGVTRLEGYPDCVKIRRRSVRMDFAGTQQVDDLTEWYAKGEGLVKAEGERYWKDAGGRRTHTEPIRFSKP